MDLEKLKKSINKYYPKRILLTDLVEKDVSKIQKLIYEKHNQRSLVNLLVKELRNINLEAVDLLMGRDYPCYIIQIVDNVDKSSVEVFTIYISFIYNCHSIFKLGMYSPEWVVSEIKIGKNEEQLVSCINELIIKYFSSEKVNNKLLQQRLDDIYIKSDFTIFNALYTVGHKISKDEEIFANIDYNRFITIDF